MYSVYGLTDPRTNQIRYIGQALDIHKRYAQHLLYPHKNDDKDAWLAELKQAGLIPSLVTLESNIGVMQINMREQYWIHHYLEQGAELTNMVCTKTFISSEIMEEIKSKVDAMPGKLINVKDVQELLGLSERTVFRLIKQGT